MQRSYFVSGSPGGQMTVAGSQAVAAAHDYMPHSHVIARIHPPRRPIRRSSNKTNYSSIKNCFLLAILTIISDSPVLPVHCDLI